MAFISCRPNRELMTFIFWDCEYVMIIVCKFLTVGMFDNLFDVRKIIFIEAEGGHTF